MNAKHLFKNVASIGLISLVFSFMTGCAQSTMYARPADVASPPSLDNFTAPLKDPLNTLPNQQLAYPVNLFEHAEVDCISLDSILYTNNAQLAEQRLQAYTQEKNEQGEALLSLQMALDLSLCHNPQVRMTCDLLCLNSHIWK